jgi:dolichol-phosphate mannosyltransferase
VYALVLRFFTDIHVPGWTALFIAVLFLGGVQLISLGIMGEYVGRIYGEAKRRPLYLLQERIGFNRPVSTPTLVRDQAFRERRSGERRRQDPGWRRSGESLSLHNA